MAYVKCSGGNRSANGTIELTINDIPNKPPTKWFTINCGFKPKYIAILFSRTKPSLTTSWTSVSKGCNLTIYNEDYASDLVFKALSNSSADKSLRSISFPITTASAQFASPIELLDNGFIYAGECSSDKNVYAGTYYWFAAR